MSVIRKTKSVKIVTDLFELKKSAISAVDLVETLHHQMNKTTVYRILDRLEKDGFVHSFLAKDGLRWYGKCLNCSSKKHFDVHPHIQCKVCGKVKCLDLKFNIPTVSNYKVDSAELLLFGQCEDCCD